MYRLPSLANALNLPTSDLAKKLLVKGKSKFFLRSGSSYFGYPSIAKAIVPPDVIEEYRLFRLNQLDKKCNKVEEEEKQKLLKGFTFQKPIKSQIINTKFQSKSNYFDQNSTQQTRIGVLLGHFNHGKTTLLDNLLENQERTLVDYEKHGITQEVRTRSIELTSEVNQNEDKSIQKKKKITIIDTPGQEIFYRMRNQGANVADFAILLIALDQGVCLQTKESIGIIENLKIPVIVCMNKIDLVQPNSIGSEITLDDLPERYYEVLNDAKEYVALENAIFIPISAKLNIGINDLKKKINQLITELDKNKKLEQENELQNSSLSLSSDFSTYYLEKSGSGRGLSSRGVVINLLSIPQQGQCLHVIITEGKISIGDYFSAGGWSGRIIKITKEEGFNSLENISSLSSGEAGILKVSFHEESSDPRPLGDPIHFFSIDSILGERANTKEEFDALISKATKKQRERAIEIVSNSAYLEMDNNIMENEFELAHLSEDSIKKYRINHLFNSLNPTSFYKFQEMIEYEDEESQATEGEDIDDYDDIVEEECEDDEELEEIVDLSPLFIIKASSEMEVSTVTDSVEDAREPFDSGEDLSLNGKLGKVIYSGVGIVSQHDVKLASSSNATILAYNVSVEKFAQKQIQSSNIKIEFYDKIQDMIERIVGHSVDSGIN